MKYLGGKTRIAKKLVPVIQDLAPDAQVWVEPFMGGASVSEIAVPRYESAHLNDIHPDLIALWDAMARGWIPPSTLTEEEYRASKSLESPNPLKGFAGFGCSFGGKYYGGYARARQSNRDYVKEAVRSCTRKSNAIKNATTSCGPYYLMDIPENAVVYCDPPYEGTTGYSNKFDHDRFWGWASRISQEGIPIFVSEYNAPSGWEQVWSIQRNLELGNAGQGPRTERLFRYVG